MKKISTLFIFDYENQRITPQVRPEHEWVLQGEGVATVKVDGTSCYFQKGQLYKRFDRKLKKQYELLRQKMKAKGEEFIVQMEYFRDLPDGAIPCVENFDPVTFHWPFWVPITKHDCYHQEAWDNFVGEIKDGQSYELIGPRVGLNKYSLDSHKLVEHGSSIVEIKDRSFESIRQYLIDNNEEGLVFHNDDGRMTKIRRSDFSKIQTRDWEWKDAKGEEFID